MTTSRYTAPMGQTKAANLVTAPVVAAALGIPLYAVYRLADQGRIPFEDHSSTWATRRRILFDLEQVREKYEELEAARRRSA